jgi:hypothetical protein
MMSRINLKECAVISKSPVFKDAFDVYKLDNSCAPGRQFSIKAFRRDLFPVIFNVDIEPEHRWIQLVRNEVPEAAVKTFHESNIYDNKAIKELVELFRPHLETRTLAKKWFHLLTNLSASPCCI